MDKVGPGIEISPLQAHPTHLTKYNNMFPCPQLTVLLLAASAAASPIEILKVEDAEAGYGHQQAGVPGQEVEGSFYWKVSTRLVSVRMLSSPASAARRPRVTRLP